MKGMYQILLLKWVEGILEIAYCHLLHTEAISLLEVDRVQVPNCGVLVLKYTPATSQQRKDVRGLLGTNVLVQIHKCVALLNKGLILSPGCQKPVPLVLFA